MTERWKPTHHPGYEVSDLGRVRSISRVVQTKSGPRHYKGIMLKPGPTSTGHLTVAIGKYQSHLVHVLVLEAFTGPRPAGADGCHSIGGRQDNRLVNLRWDTRGHNLMEAYLFGGRPR